jgi:hypothetical protein
MGRYEVTCINKRGDHHNPHERISYIGYQGKWRMVEDSAIRRIESQQDSFYVTKGGRQVDVVVAVHNGRKYLKTEADGYVPNNLLSLPECIGCNDVNS